MEIAYVVETTNGTMWKATCSDPHLEAEGPDILSVSKSMAEKIESWIVNTFGTPKKVVVEVPKIKAKIKANIVVRPETPLTEYTPPEPIRLENKVYGPCAYLSDGKGVLPVGECEARSMDPADTPGIRVDADGLCMAEFEKCTYYKPLVQISVQDDEDFEDVDDNINEYE